MQQVLVNLVKNAAQAMTNGGTLTLQTGENADAVWVSVADLGGGIPQEQINRIFEPFYTTKKKAAAYGLMIQCSRNCLRNDGKNCLEKSRRSRHDISDLAAAARNVNQDCWKKKKMWKRTNNLYG